MRALILSGYGINCEDETLNAFKTAGIKATIVHVNDLIENIYKLKNFQVNQLFLNYQYFSSFHQKLKLTYLHFLNFFLKLQIN